MCVHLRIPLLPQKIGEGNGHLCLPVTDAAGPHHPVAFVRWIEHWKLLMLMALNPKSFGL